MIKFAAPSFGGDGTHSLEMRVSKQNLVSVKNLNITMINVQICMYLCIS